MYTQIAQSNNSRDSLLAAFYKRSRLSQLSDDTGSKELVKFYSRKLHFPENIIFTHRELLFLYFQYYSEYMLKNGFITSPVIPLCLPDGTVRPITLQEGDSGVASKEVMQYASLLEKPATLTDRRIIESFLTHLKPDLSLAVCTKLQVDNAVKREALTSSPKHSIPQVGMYLAIDQVNNPDIAASRLFVDRSASHFNVLIGNKALALQLDDNYQLCASDGTPLQVNPITRIWWDHIILPQLYQYICRAPEEHDGYVDGITPGEGESAAQATRRLIYSRVGFLRTLGLTKEGKEKHHTQEQRTKVLRVEFPLPKVKHLDLDVHNVGRPFGEKQTYVLPVERELTKPPIFHLPHAYADTKDIFLR